MEKIGDALWKIPKEGSMRVPALVFGTEKIIKKMKKDRTLEQIKNVASLPHIVKHALVMPDGHEGYGFPIGGVAAFDYEKGIISPGGVGYDINCGVRLIKTNLTYDEIREKIKPLTKALFKNIPSGVGREGKLHLSIDELDEVAKIGVKWAVEKGYGEKKDIERIEENGSMEGKPEFVSKRAKKRGKNQLGTLGAGNHFLEIQKVEKIFNKDIAKKFGLHKDQVVIMIHTGSRGYGHQICSDYVFEILSKTNNSLPDKELAYAYFNSDLGQKYFGAMKAAVNFAFTNRQLITHWTREVFYNFFENVELELLYDVAHNIAKIEEHFVDGEKRKLIVHRKGATRAFPKGRSELKGIYYNIGQPVLVPGSMGTASYVLIGTEKALEMTFGSTCHGSGRVMSRKKAKETHNYNKLINNLNKKGIYIISASQRGILEEAPDAYKDVDEVVRSLDIEGISKPVSRNIPLAVVKG